MPPSISSLPPARGLSLIANDGEELLVSHPPLDPQVSSPVAVYAAAEMKNARLLASLRPRFAGVDAGLWRIDAGLALGIGSSWKGVPEGEVMLDVGVRQAHLKTRTGPVSWNFLPEVRMLHGAASSLSAWQPRYESHALLSALEAGPAHGPWAVGLGGSATVGSLGGFLSFIWRGEQKHESTRVGINKPAIPDWQRVYEHFDDLDLQTLRSDDLSDLKGFLGIDGKPLTNIDKPADLIPNFNEMVSFPGSSDEQPLTLVFHLSDFPDKTGKPSSREEQLRQLRRAVLFLFLSGDEKTNPYYNRFHRFRFLVSRTAEPLSRPADEKLQCGSVPGLDEQGDAIAEFLFNAGIRKPTIVHALADCRSQGAPLDYGPVSQDFLQLAALVSGDKTAKLETAQTLAEKIADRDGFAGIERLRSLAEESLDQGSLKPLAAGLIRHHWAPRVYLEVSNPALYPVLRHELGHTLIAWSKGSASHPWALDGYVEEENDLQQQATREIDKNKEETLEAFKQSIRSGAAKTFWKKNPLFPTLYLGSTTGGPPTEKEIRLTLEKEEDVKNVLEGLKRGELTWVEQGLYLKNSGIWQLQMRVDAQGKPDATQPPRFSHMTDSNEPAPVDPIVFREIRKMLDGK